MNASIDKVTITLSDGATIEVFPDRQLVRWMASPVVGGMNEVVVTTLNEFLQTLESVRAKAQCL